MNWHEGARSLWRWPQPSLGLALLPAGIVLLALYILPLGRLVATSFVDDGALSIARYADLLTSPAFLSIAGRTLQTSALVTLLCLVLGYPLAYVINRVSGRLAFLLLLLVLVPFFTSVLIRSYAWVVILGNNGLINQVLMALGVVERPVQLVYSHLGVVIGMAQVQLPLLVLPVYSVMRGIDRSLVPAARSLGASPASAFWHVFRPLSLPGVAAGVTLVFVSSLGFYVTPALLGGPGDYLIAQAIQVRVTQLADFGAATAQATLLLIAVGGLMLLFRRPLGLSLQGAASEKVAATAPRRRLPVPSGRARFHWSHIREISGANRLRSAIGGVADATRNPLLALVSIASVVLLILPMVVVFPLAFSDGAYLSFPPPGYSTRWFESYLGNDRWLQATGFSLILATVSAAFASCLGLLAAFAFARARIRGGALLYLMYLSPLIVPQIAFAVALFFVLAPAGLTGTPWAFIGAYTVLGLPFTLVVMTAVLQRFDRAVEQAGSSLGAAPWRVLWSITLPLIRPALVTGFLFAFLISFDDVVIALFMSGPQAVPLPIRMWEDIRFEISPRIAAVAVLFFVFVFVAVAAFVGARRGNRMLQTFRLSRVSDIDRQP